MDKVTETVLIIVIAGVVLYVAMIDPIAAMLITILVVAGYVIYRNMYRKPKKEIVLRKPRRKTTAKGQSRRKR